MYQFTNFLFFFFQIVQQEENGFNDAEMGVEGSTSNLSPESQGCRLGVRCLVGQFGKRAASYALTSSLNVVLHLTSEFSLRSWNKWKTCSTEHRWTGNFLLKLYNSACFVLCFTASKFHECRNFGAASLVLVIFLFHSNVELILVTVFVVSILAILCSENAGRVMLRHSVFI